jgi:phosphatidylinositol alpha-1,6-mannosyltransferase
MVATVQGVPRDRIGVIYPAVDPVLLRAAPDSNGPAGRDGVTLLTVARLSARERYKGCDAVIAALPAVRAGGPVRYVIVGDGDDRPRLEALARSHGVAPLVTFAGAVQHDGLPEWYRACDIYVMPSVAEQRPDGWTGEGFGIAYLEAAAFGRPVIAGSGGGAPEAVQDGVTGVVVDGRDVAAVAAAIARLRDPETRARMGEAGRQWVRRQFTVERFQRDVEALISEGVSAALR